MDQDARCCEMLRIGTAPRMSRRSRRLVRLLVRRFVAAGGFALGKCAVAASTFFITSGISFDQHRHRADDALEAPPDPSHSIHDLAAERLAAVGREEPVDVGELGDREAAADGLGEADRATASRSAVRASPFPRRSPGPVIAMRCSKCGDRSSSSRRAGSFSGALPARRMPRSGGLRSSILSMVDRAHHVGDHAGPTSQPGTAHRP